jgi:predicted transposase/invertase (TIGR01784 family)
MMNLSAAYRKKQEEWKQEGIQQGVQQGIQQVAINMLRRGVAIDVIIDTTELTLTQVNQLCERFGIELGN